MMKLARSSFYYRPRGKSPDQMKAEADLRDRIETTCLGFPWYPNLVKGMVIRRLNQVWLADITYIRIRTGFIYLGDILDAYSRKVDRLCCFQCLGYCPDASSVEGSHC